jgi:hypothetical protein
MDKKNIIFQKLKNFAIQNQIPGWPFGEKNSYLVTYIGVLYDDIFTLLTSNIFSGDLCLYKSINEVDEEFNILHFKDNELENFKFFNSNLTKKQYYKKYISIFSNYRKFLESAVLYYLKISIEKNNVPHFMRLFSQILIANKTYTSVLYKNMKNINIFSIFTLECLEGFFYNFTDFKIIVFFSFDNTNGFLITEKTHNVFRFLNIFSFYFSPEFRSTCFKQCIQTKSYIPMFLALKIYKANLSVPKLTLNELNKVQCISDFKTTVLIHDVISEKTIDQLIEKNWRYHNYE